MASEDAALTLAQMNFAPRVNTSSDDINPNYAHILFDPFESRHTFYATYEEAFATLTAKLNEFNDDPTGYKTLIEGFMILKLKTYVEVEKQKTPAKELEKLRLTEKVIRLFGLSIKKPKIQVKHLE